MPFRHVAMYRWADHVDAAHVQRVRVAFDQLAEQATGLRQHAHGNDVGVSEGSFDFHVVADFETAADWRAYRDHPSHVLLVEELIVGHVTERAGGQFQVADERSAHEVSSAGMQAMLAEPDSSFAPPPPAVPETDAPGDSESDDELLARARRIATAEMQSLLTEPDDPNTAQEDERDDELLARARRIATAEMDALLAEPDGLE